MNIDAPMIDGWTPLFYAAINGYPTIVQLLAAPYKNEHTRVIEKSLCNINAVDKFHRNALHWVVRQFSMGNGALNSERTQIKYSVDEILNLTEDKSHSS